MTERQRNIIKYFGPVFGWLVLIFIASSISSLPDVSEVKFPIDKLVHFVEYTIFGFLLIRAIYFSSIDKDVLRAALIMIGTALFIAATDEFHQLYIPDRVASLSDFIADVAGISLAVILFPYYRSSRKP